MVIVPCAQTAVYQKLYAWLLKTGGVQWCVSCVARARPPAPSPHHHHSPLWGRGTPRRRLAVLDCDEFFVPANTTHTLKDVMRHFDGVHTASVAFNRLFFGTEGLADRPSGSVIGGGPSLSGSRHHACQANLHAQLMRATMFPLSTPPPGNYVHHINPYTRLFDDWQLHQVKSVLRVGPCPTGRVDVHGCHVNLPTMPAAVGTNGVQHAYYEKPHKAYVPQR
jgi:hypothetical protein